MESVIYSSSSNYHGLCEHAVKLLFAIAEAVAVDPVATPPGILMSFWTMMIGQRHGADRPWLKQVRHATCLTLTKRTSDSPDYPQPLHMSGVFSILPLLHISISSLASAHTDSCSSSFFWRTIFVALSTHSES